MSKVKGSGLTEICRKLRNEDIRLYIIQFFLWRCDLTRVMASSFLRFLDHTQRHTTVGRTPLDEWSARRRDLYLTTHNTHRQAFMPPVGFEPTISAGERPQTYALERVATGTGKLIFTDNKKIILFLLWEPGLWYFVVCGPVLRRPTSAKKKVWCKMSYILVKSYLVFFLFIFFIVVLFEVAFPL